MPSVYSEKVWLVRKWAISLWSTVGWFSRPAASDSSEAEGAGCSVMIIKQCWRPRVPWISVLVKVQEEVSEKQHTSLTDLTTPISETNQNQAKQDFPGEQSGKRGSGFKVQQVGWCLSCLLVESRGQVQFSHFTDGETVPDNFVKCLYFCRSLIILQLLY